MLKFEIGKPIEAFNATPSRIKPIQPFARPDAESQGYQVRQPNGAWIEVQNAVEVNHSGALSYTLEGCGYTANAGEWRSPPAVPARMNSITTKAMKRRVYLTLGFLALIILIILRILLQVAAEI